MAFYRYALAILLTIVHTTTASNIYVRPTDADYAAAQLHTKIPPHSLGKKIEQKRVFQVDIVVDSSFAASTSSKSRSALWTKHDQPSMTIELPGGDGKGQLTHELVTAPHIADHYWASSNSEAYVLYNPDTDALVATVSNADGSTYTINTRPDGTRWMTVLKDEERMSEEHKGIPPASINSNHQKRNLNHRRMQGDSGDVVDVMVAYTREAMCDEAGFPNSNTCAVTDANKAPIEELIQLAVNNNNVGHAASNTGLQLELVHVYLEDGYDEPSSQSNILNDLTNAGDGKLENAHTLRDHYNADLVAIITNVGSGVAWLFNGEGSGFSVTNKDYIGGHTFAHELGHNIGCWHDRANSNGAASDYNFGYQNPGASIRSIQAYGCSNTYCQRVNMYATPLYTYNGDTIGTTTEDCARTIRENKFSIANYREGDDAPNPAPIALTPAPVPAPTVSDCYDIEGWTDAYGDDCTWYETNDSEGCPSYGNMWPNPTTGITPGDACCFCGGGVPNTTDNPSHSPSAAPTAGTGSVDCSSFTTKRSCNQSEGCSWKRLSGEKYCDNALSTSECEEWESKKRKCKKNGCKFNKNTKVCKGRWN